MNAAWFAARHVRATLLQITLVTLGDDLRLRRLTCGKALPFRKTSELSNLLLAGWKAEPSSLRAGGNGVRHRPESRRLFRRLTGRAALCVGVSW